MTRTLSKGLGTLTAAVLTASLLSSAATAQTPEDFYRGKTLRLMHVTGPGGTMDLYALLVIKHMQKHLPAGTSVVLEHRPGAGGSSAPTICTLPRPRTAPSSACRHRRSSC